MDVLIVQMKNTGSIPAMNSITYNERVYLITNNTLNNMHKSKHTLGYFKNKKYMCKIKLLLQVKIVYNKLAINLQTSK